MTTEKTISTPDPRVITILKKIIADQKLIHEHIRSGRSLSELASTGFKFVQFMEIPTIDNLPLKDVSTEEKSNQ
jgi:hypothetical protein